MKNKVKQYEVIDYLYGYILKNYNGARLISEKSLELENFIQNDFESSEKNCSLVASTRVIKYYADRISILPKDESEIFKQIYTLAQKYNYNEKIGIFSTKVDDILRDYFTFFKVNTISRGHYFGNFYKPVKKEIDENRPLVMNIAFGEYHNHTVTVTGYKIFKFKNMKIKFIELYDGWRREKSYIDYNIFAQGIFSKGICSYYTIKIINN
ncbi:MULTISPECIES: hypothetical protein [Peptoniphilus]|uniref:hypothetical protein n=1 Tax=Peptoniphilus TaxID=162289 RepID=UPI0001DA99ED|nr:MULTISPECIES: hypothetical protein [Peptoniphilus]EFI41799.1 hypothetical protein HMPREF0629_00425 [Peptoniphilus sp. oral taxon 386 str. F0131]